MAGFKALTAKLAQTAIGIVGDLSVDVTYSHITGMPSYDPLTNVMTKTVTTETFKGVLTTKSVNEYDYSKVEDSHLKIIVAANLITFVPASEDTCVINGVNYEVKRIKSVPGDAIYLVYIQAT